MIIYITPDNLDKFRNRIERSLSCLNHRPSIMYSEPTLTKVREVETCEGKTYCRMVNLITVEIEDIKAAEWVLVANVEYNENLVAMVDGRYFKDMPAYYGLNYNMCDFCGHNHPNRRRAHVIYNPEMNEWKQVGSSCVEKMCVDGRYVSQFLVSLVKIIRLYGCLDGDFGGWVRGLASRYFTEGISMESMVYAAKLYIEKNCTNYQKASYENGYRIEGTSDDLNRFFTDLERQGALETMDTDYIQKVRDYVMTLPDGEFNDQLKNAFTNEYICRYQAYLPFFAVKMYNEYLTLGDWNAIASQFTEDTIVSVINARIVSRDVFIERYGWSTVYTHSIIFEDENGVKFHKNFSSEAGLNKFSNGNDTYSFQTTVGYIDNRKRTINLNGRGKKI